MSTLLIPTFLPLAEAARKHGIPVAELRQRIETGTIQAGILPDVGIIVSENALNGQPEPTNGHNRNTASAPNDINAQLAAIKREDFAHLRGQAITVTEAAEAFGVYRRTILRWVKKKYIGVIEPGYQMKLNKSDIAYCAAIHRRRQKLGIYAGVPLCDKRGQPYQLKHPALSRYRKEQKSYTTVSE